MPEIPLPNGRNSAGQYVKGREGGPGNPWAAKCSIVKAQLAKAVTREDVRKIALALMARAKKGDVNAIREFFDRLIGKARQPIDIEGANLVQFILRAEVPMMLTQKERGALPAPAEPEESEP